MSSTRTRLVTVRLPNAVYEALEREATNGVGALAREVLTKHTTPPPKALIRALSQVADQIAKKKR